jgi:hypothetical protein
MAGEEGSSSQINKLSPVVSLNGFRCGAKLCLSAGNELNNVAVHLRFLSKRKRPPIMRKIIQQNKIVFKSRDAEYGRCPHITMN